MLKHLSSVAIRAPRRVVAGWFVILVLGVGAAGFLFSELDADLDGAPSFESEEVNRRLDRLAPGGGEVVAVVDGAPVPDATLDQLREIDGVEDVLTLPSDDGEATAVAVPLVAGLDDAAEEDTLDTVTDALR
jgi:hypothetical protein